MGSYTLWGDVSGKQVWLLYALLLELLSHLSRRLLLADFHALLPPGQAAIQHLYHHVQPAPQIVPPACHKSNCLYSDDLCVEGWGAYLTWTWEGTNHYVLLIIRDESTTCKLQAM